ncbi:MAG: PhzF family phenazine biosynthesis protein [Chloroflexi bacterium]|nr:PhzF family phenazine biosynthesis protein [Chloroflexota bacterium]
MKIPYYHVDAFTSRRFAGNPAGVCVLQEWLPDELLLNIAFENNLSETAFIVSQGDHYALRWFTPTTEVDLCGHATLATAFVVFHYLGYVQPEVRFQTQSGLLTVARQGDLLVMDFPARPPGPCETPEALLRGLGCQPLEVLRSRDYFALFASAQEVAELRPDFSWLEKLECTGIIVTAPGKQVDFVSRFFAPQVGIPEDPVTGSAHSTLVPYWSQRLGKKKLTARQLSARGGELFCEDAGERVKIGGRAVGYLQGEIEL